MIKIKIDVTKISKEKLYVGKKGTYLNAVLIETPNSEFSDYMIVEETTKEAREAGEKGVIIGNAKMVVKTGAYEEELHAPTAEEIDDLPF